MQGVDGTEEGVNEGIFCISQWSLFINILPLSQYYDVFPLKCNRYVKLSYFSEDVPGQIGVNIVTLCSSINRLANC